jgi:hypothetical protein
MLPCTACDGAAAPPSSGLRCACSSLSQAAHFRWIVSSSLLVGDEHAAHARCTVGGLDVSGLVNFVFPSVHLDSGSPA